MHPTLLHKGWTKYHQLLSTWYPICLSITILHRAWKPWRKYKSVLYNYFPCIIVNNSRTFQAFQQICDSLSGDVWLWARRCVTQGQEMCDSWPGDVWLLARRVLVHWTHVHFTVGLCFCMGTDYSKTWILQFPRCNIPHMFHPMFCAQDTKEHFLPIFKRIWCKKHFLLLGTSMKVVDNQCLSNKKNIYKYLYTSKTTFSWVCPFKRLDFTFKMFNMICLKFANLQPF